MEKEYDYIENRVKPQIIYYSKTSVHCKRLYMLFSVLNIIVAALIPVSSLLLSNYATAKYVVAILGAMVTISSSINYFCKYKEKWIQSRMTCESIKSELAQYYSSAFQYLGMSNMEKNDLLVKNCETLFIGEHLSWKDFAEKKNDS